MSRLSAMLVDVKTETRTPPISPHGSFETIRSGQFMVSTLNDTDILSEDESQSPNSVSSKDAATHATLYGAPPDAKPSEDDLSVATTSSSVSTSTSTRPPAGFDFRNACQEARHLNCQFGGGGQPPTFGIDESLTKLLECMTITYRTQITNPKWNSFRGLKVSMRDKIRLNNIIWREYHMQFVKKKRPIVVQFTSALSENHANPEAIVMEGKYWKRKLQIVRQEYQSCRQVLRHLTSRNSHSKRGSYSGVKGSGSGGPGGVGGALGAGGAGVVGDLALTQSPQPRRIRQRSLSHLETGGLGGGVVPNLSAEELVGEQHQMMMELEEHMNYIQQHHNSTVGGGGVVGVGMNTQSPGTMLDDLMMATFDDLDMSLFEPSSSTMMWNADVIQPDLSQLQPNVDDISNLELFSTVFPMSSTTSGPTTSMMLMESQTHFMYAPQQQISMSNNLPTTTMEFMDIDSTAASQQQLPTLMGDSRFSSSSSSSSAYHASKTSESRFPVSSSSHHLPPAPPRYRSTKSSEEASLPQANYLQQDEMVMLKSSPFTSVTSSSPRKEETVDSVRYQQQQLHYQNQSQSRSYHDIHRGATHNTSTGDVPHRQMSATHLSSYSERSKSAISAGGSTSSATNSSVSMPPAGTGRGSLPSQLVAIAPKPEMTTYTQPVMQAMPPPPPRHQSVSEVIFTSGPPHETASSSSGVYSQHNTAHSPLRRVMEELDTKSFDTSSSVGGSELDGSSRSYLARRQPSCVNITQGFSQLENLLRQLQASQQQQPNSTASSLHQGGPSTSSLSSSASSTSRSSSNPGPGVMLMSTLGPKTSKATLLHKAAEHIRRMKEQQRRMDHEIAMLETEIHMLQGDLNHSCSQLPATGVDLNKRPSQQGQAWFQEFVLHRSATHWKFYPFSLFLRRLFLTYNATLANVNASMLPLAVRSWLEQHCAMLSLRQLATDSLREMIHTTSILTTPQCVPEEVAHLVSEKRRALLAEVASLRHAPPPPQQRMALPPPPPPSAPAPSPPVMPVPSVHSKPLLRPAPSHPPPPRYPSPLATSSSSSKVPLYAISSSQQLRPRAVASSTGMYHHLHAHQPSSAASSSSTSSGSTAPPSSSPGVPSSNHFFDVPFHQPKRPGTTVGRGGPRGAPASKRNVPS